MKWLDELNRLLNNQVDTGADIFAEHIRDILDAYQDVAEAAQELKKIWDAFYESPNKWNDKQHDAWDEAEKKLQAALSKLEQVKGSE